MQFFPKEIPAPRDLLLWLLVRGILRYNQAWISLLEGTSRPSVPPIGSADAEDFGGVFPSGTLTFVPGKTSKTITINVVGDTVVEPDEMFWVGLLHPSLGAAIPIRNQSAH